MYKVVEHVMDICRVSHTTACHAEMYVPVCIVECRVIMRKIGKLISQGKALRPGSMCVPRGKETRNIRRRESICTMYVQGIAGFSWNVDR